jgi:murein DD-endopeptidase MepM/ murein hydrolase activator NlpD
MSQYNRRRSYDDMNPDSRKNREDRKLIALRRVAAAVMVLLTAAAVTVAVLLVQRSHTPESGSDTNDVTSLPIQSEAAPETLLEIDPLPSEMPAADQSAGTGDGSPEDSSDDIDSKAIQAAQDPEPEKQAESAVKQEQPEAASRSDDSSAAPVSFTSYTVYQGDTLTKIASLYGLEPETIVGVNSINDVDEIKTGTVLQIPDRDGQMYEVRKGDSLSVIAYRYDMGYLTLAEANGLTSSLIRIGQKLFIPNRTISKEQYRKVMNTLFVRPSQGSTIAAFHEKVENILTGEYYPLDGIRIEDEPGTPVKASMSGTVVEVNNDPTDGMGRYVVLSHNNGYSTMYAHLDTQYVSVGDAVQQEDVIGTLGTTGRILEPTLYFSIRKDGTPVDPAQYF